MISFTAGGFSVVLCSKAGDVVPKDSDRPYLTRALVAPSPRAAAAFLSRDLRFIPLNDFKLSFTFVSLLFHSQTHLNGTASQSARLLETQVCSTRKIDQSSSGNLAQHFKAVVSTIPAMPHPGLFEDFEVFNPVRQGMRSVLDSDRNHGAIRI
jgi:hypothetical protein